MKNSSKKINIVEVGPRDGLQNVTTLLSLDQKKNFIGYLLNKGFEDIEAGSFVRADKIPPMADSDQIALHFKNENSKLWYLAPNQKGLEKALECGVRQLAFFTAVSETFNQKNIGMSCEKSFETIEASLGFLKDKNYNFITDWAKKPQGEKDVKIRLYISTVIGCPYEGPIKPQKTIEALNRFLPQPIAQFSLGDTIGVGVPKNWKELLNLVPKNLISNDKIAMHCHDTYSTSLACVAEGLNLGINTFDSSIGGLGGCPYAKGATGNLATEDLLYFLEKEGLETSVKLSQILDCFNQTRTGNLENISKIRKALAQKS